MSRRDEYTVHGDSVCFFCGLPKVARFYRPSIQLVKAQGVHGEMNCYVVCGKCLARCQHSTLPHAELIEFIAKLEARGSRPGRVSTRVLVENLCAIDTEKPHVFEVDGVRVEFVAKRVEGNLVHLVFENATKKATLDDFLADGAESPAIGVFLPNLSSQGSLEPSAGSKELINELQEPSAGVLSAPTVEWGFEVNSPSTSSVVPSAERKPTSLEDFLQMEEKDV